ncbi:Signal transduction response regulator, receiver region domain protein [Candidatus Magnetobacterium bavaricum]|uniref:Signal transduction response regulator, receiver region domain protein n=1 Tax=Candidatus Magnetobacterium bavaricum TaxID=29290 RepID=A0A0F3H1N1_9BACT|nr:Signal transduction response regulator, receiver region domain protein [Candidatus Magnetobacterium bavaricum]
MDRDQLFKDKSLLYVEDDEVIRVNIAHFLRRRFKEVTEAENGRQGLDLYTPGTYDVVITDIEMPIMNGLKMINKILEIDPAQRIIITTGYNDDEHKSNKACVNIIKPVIREVLLTSLYRCLNK